VKNKPRDHARRGFGSRLHALVHDHDVTAVAAGKERCAEWKAVDFTFHFQAPACTPSLGDVQGDADDHPLQGRVETLDAWKDLVASLLVIS
jgi:hypothetical protein